MTEMKPLKHLHNQLVWTKHHDQQIAVALEHAMRKRLLALHRMSNNDVQDREV
jgi:hypothetical protein